MSARDQYCIRALMYMWTMSLFLYDKLYLRMIMFFHKVTVGTLLIYNNKHIHKYVYF